jgi:drug/metabolite transporter (DMT)-like permease
VPIRPLVVLLGLAATWGGSYPLISVALRSTTPAALTWGRFLPAAVLVVLLAARRGELRALRGRWPSVLLLALVQQAAPMLLIAVGERRVPSGLAGTLVASTPIWGALLAPLLGRPAPAPLGWLGLVAGIAGVGLLLGVETGSGALLGSALIVLAAVGYAVGAALTARQHDVPRQALLAGVLTCSSVLLLPAVLVDRPDRLPSAGGLLAVAVLGLVGTGIAFLCFYWLVDEVGPERTVLVTYLSPVFAVGYGVVLLGERLTAGIVVGLLLVLAGAALAARRPRRRPPVDTPAETPGEPVSAR